MSHAKKENEGLVYKKKRKNDFREKEEGKKKKGNPDETQIRQIE